MLNFTETKTTNHFTLLFIHTHLNLCCFIMIYDLLGLFSIRKLCIEFARHLHFARK